MRKHYLDNIRWMTVVIVVIYHVIYMYNGVQPFGVLGAFSDVQYQDAFQYIVYPWFMTLLFVVSGISARYYLENHTEKEFVRTRTRKLLVPSTIGLFVFQWIQGYYNMLIGNAFETMPVDTMPKPVVWGIMSISGIGPLWYIQMLWLFSMVLLLIRKIEKDRIYKVCKKCGIIVLLVITPVIYFAAQVLNTPVITVYRFGIYGLCFLIGYFILSHDEVVERLIAFWCPLAIAAVGLAIAYVALYFGENYAVEPTINCPLACVYCWIAILAIFAVMTRFGDKTSDFAAWMNKKPWGVYIFHYLPLSIVAYYLSQVSFQMPAICYYLLVAVSAFAGAILLYEIIRRIPIIRWCVLGIKKER